MFKRLQHGIDWRRWLPLTAQQRRLVEEIEQRLHGQTTREVVYRTSWLGYLPDPFYVWLECNDGEWLDAPWTDHDLTVLERRGWLQKQSSWIDPNDDCERRVVYRVAKTMP